MWSANDGKHPILSRVSYGGLRWLQLMTSAFGHDPDKSIHVRYFHTWMQRVTSTVKESHDEDCGWSARSARTMMLWKSLKTSWLRPLKRLFCIVHCTVFSPVSPLQKNGPNRYLYHQDHRRHHCWQQSQQPQESEYEIIMNKCDIVWHIPKSWI